MICSVCSSEIKKKGIIEASPGCQGREFGPFRPSNKYTGILRGFANSCKMSFVALEVFSKF